MVSKDDIIYVKINDDYTIIGSGYKSKNDIIKKIKNHYRKQIQNQDIEFGICDSFDKISTVTSEDVQDKEDNIVKMSDKDKSKLKDIRSAAVNDDRIIDFSDRDYEQKKNAKYSRTAVKYQNNIRYDNAVDFSIKLNNSLFNNIPITRDEKDVNKVKSIFNSVAGDNAIYLGYYSTYASRGRKNPFVRAYGRIKRDSEKETQFIDIFNEGFVVGHYWTESNLSPVPIYHIKDSSMGNKKQDYIIIINKISSQTEYKNLTNDSTDYALSKRSYIEENYDYTVNWIGKVSYNQEFDQICFGISYNK